MDMIHVRHERDVTVLTPQVRRLDSTVAPAFKKAVLKVVRDGHKRLVLDRDNVDFMDSSGLGALVSVLKASGGSGGLGICNTKGGVFSLFKLTRMDKVFILSASAAEAVQKAAG